MDGWKEHQKQTPWAAGWGWFVDATLGDDSEFTTPDNQGESAAADMELLTVLEHELGHLLGYEHEPTGVMADTLKPGVRRMHSAASRTAWLAAVDELFSDLRPYKRHW